MNRHNTDLDGEALDALVRSHEVVLLDFWAEWCLPCQSIAPLIDETAQQHAGAIKVIKINIDQQAEVARALAVRSIPTLIIFRHGQEISRYQGVMNKLRLTRWIAASWGEE